MRRENCLQGILAGVLTVAFSWSVPCQAQAKHTIADFTVDFSTTTFPVGWQYLRNIGPIGTSTNYAPLLRDSIHNRYDVDGQNFPAPGPLGPDYTLVDAGGSVHPGPGIAQAAAFNHYVIAAYTIQAGQAGHINLVNGSLAGNDVNGAGGNSNGWDLRIYVGDLQIGATSTFPWSLSAAIAGQPARRRQNLCGLGTQRGSPVRRRKSRIPADLHANSGIHDGASW